MLESCAYLYIITQMDKHYNISDFARRIGRSASTVRRWERDGYRVMAGLASSPRGADCRYHPGHHI